MWLKTGNSECGVSAHSDSHTLIGQNHVDFKRSGVLFLFFLTEMAGVWFVVSDNPIWAKGYAVVCRSKDHSSFQAAHNNNL